MNDVNLDDLKAIPIAEVVAASGLTVIGRGHVLTTQEHDSLKLFLRTNSYYWFRQEHGGSPIDWVMHTQRVDFKRACEILGQHRHLAVPYYQPPPVPAPPAPLDPTLPEHFLRNLNAEHLDWWQARNIDWRAIQHFKLGVYEHSYYGTCYTIPVYEHGELVNIRLRLAQPKRPQDKYRPYDEGRGTHLYNGDILTPDLQGVVLVAGELKCVVLWQHAIPAISPTAGCGHWRSEWTTRLTHCRKVFVCYDPGELDAALERAQEIGPRAHVVELHDAKPDDFIAAHGAEAFRLRLKLAWCITAGRPTQTQIDEQLAQAIYAARERPTTYRSHNVPWRAYLWHNETARR